MIIVLCSLILLAFCSVLLWCFCYQGRTEKKTIPYVENTVLPSFPIFDVDDMGNNALHIASKFNHHMVACYCFNKISATENISSWDAFDKFINAQNYSWDTPLHIAIKNNSKDVFDIILRNRATNFTLLDQLGRTPLHLAIDVKNKYFIEKLLEKNVNLDVTDRMGRAPRKMLKITKSEFLQELNEKST